MNDANVVPFACCEIGPGFVRSEIFLTDGEWTVPRPKPFEIGVFGCGGGGGGGGGEHDKRQWWGG